MKRAIALLLMFLLLLPTNLWATKITELTEDTAPTSDDLAVTVNNPGGTPATRKVTLTNLSKGLDHGNINGLGDDDHTQYHLTDGTRAMSGDLDMDGNDVDDSGVLFQREQADADADVAGQGQWWTNTATPNEPYHTRCLTHQPVPQQTS